jgi:hypothetical protein
MSEKDTLIPPTSSGKVPPGAGIRSSRHTINDSNDKASGTNGSDDDSSTTASGYGSTNRDMAYERVRSSDDDDDDRAPNNSNGSIKYNSSHINRSSEDVRSPNDQRYVNAEEGRGVSKSSNSDSKRLPRVARFGGGGPLAQGYRQVNVATASPSPTSPARALSSDDAHTADNPGSDGRSPVQTWCEFAARYPKLTVNFDDPDAISFEFAIYTFTIEKEGNDHLISEVDNIINSGFHKFNADDVLIPAHTRTIGRVDEADGEGTSLLSEGECRSVYDFLGYHSMPSYWHVLTAVGVMALQVTLLVYVVTENYCVANFPAATLDLMVVRVFIAMYLSISLAGTISEASMVVLSEFVSEGLMYTNACPYRVQVLFTTLYVLLRVFVSPFLWILGLLSGKLCFCGGCHGFGSERPKCCCCRYVCRWRTLPAKSYVLLMGECIVVAAMLCATGLITKQQSDVLNSIFYFISLSLILDFDEFIANMWAFKPVTVQFNEQRFCDKQRERKHWLAKFIVAWWIFFVMFVYLLDSLFKFSNVRLAGLMNTFCK